MATLPETAETAEWVAVYQLEQSDPVLGGAPNEATGAGMDNIPHLHLVKRTAWLRARVLELIAAVSSITSMTILRLTGTAPATLTSTDHGLQIGASDGPNLIADQNDIMARNNSAAAGISINRLGGDVTIGASTSNVALPGATALQGPTTAASVITSSVDDGTPIAGATYRPDPMAAAGRGNMRHIVNAAAFTLAAPNRAGDYDMRVLISNGATAGAITMSGFTAPIRGDAFTTISGDKFLVSIVKHGAVVKATVEACQ